MALAAIATATASAAPPGPQTLNQARSQGFTCNAVGGGTICSFLFVNPYGPVDTGFVCQSSTGAFDIFDQGTETDAGKLFFDQNGNLTRVRTDVTIDGGEWSNQLTGQVVPYTQRNTETFDLAVPGDVTSATLTITGENIYQAGTGGRPVFLAVGRQVFNWDQSELISSSGPNAFIAFLFEGDTDAFDQVCAALGAT
jgi:hypothetical protein